MIPPHFNLLYIDPGTGSMLFSVLIGAAATLYFLFRALIIKAQKYFFRMTGITVSHTVNPYIIYAEGKQYWNVFKPILDAFESRQKLLLYLTSTVKHYAHILHTPSDTTMYRLFGLDYFDSILLTGDYQNQDIRKLEQLRELPEKKLRKRITLLPYWCLPPRALRVYLPVWGKTAGSADQNQLAYYRKTPSSVKRSEPSVLENFTKTVQRCI